MENLICSYRRSEPHIEMPYLQRHDEMHEIYYLSSGKRKYYVGGQVYSNESGDFVFIKSGILHRTTYNDNSFHSRYYALIPSSWFSEISHLLPDSFFVKGQDKLELYFAELVREKELGDSYSAFRAKGLASIIISEALRANKKENTETDFVKDVLDYVASNIDKDLTLNNIAKHYDLAPNYFTSVFHNKSGMTLSDAIKMVKLEKASKLLEESSYSISEISALCGFNDPGYFSSVFRSQMKISPYQYRKKYNLR